MTGVQTCALSDLEEYKQALKMKKVKDKIDNLEFELYVKKAEQNQLRLEIFTNRKVDIFV